MKASLEASHQEKINDLYYEKLVKPALKEHYKRAIFKVETCLNNENQHQIKEHLNHLNVMFTQRYKSEHPYSSAWQQYGDFILKQEKGRAAQSKLDMIEIGASVEQIMDSNTYVHNCNYLNDIRDQQRFHHKLNSFAKRKQIMGENSLQRLNKIQIAVETMVSNDAICVNGTEKCFRKSKTAYANQVYDLTPKILFPTFQNHGLQSLTVMINLPYQLTVFDKYKCYKDQFHYKCVPSNNNNLTGVDIIMGYLREDGSEDPSHLYTHDGDLIMYLTNPILRGKDFGYDFDLNIEIKEEAGMWKRFLIHKTTFAGTVRTILPTGLEDKKLLPKPKEFFKHNFNAKALMKRIGKLEFMDKDKYILVDSAKFEGLLSYITSREDSDITNAKILQYMRGQMETIYIAHKAVMPKWPITYEEMVQTAMHALFIAIRNKRQFIEYEGKMINKMTKEIKDRPWDRLIESFKDSIAANFDSDSFISELFQNKILKGKLLDFDYNTINDRMIRISTLGHKDSDIGKVDRHYSQDPYYKYSVDNKCQYEESIKAIEIMDGTTKGDYIDIDIGQDEYDRYKNSLNEFLNENNFNDKMALYLLAKDTLNNLPDKLNKFNTSRVSLITGPPGSGKTTKFIKDYKNKECLYISQTNEQCTDMEERLIKTNGNIKCMTFQKALVHLLKGNDYANIVVDEAFMRPLIYYALILQVSKCNLVLLGDPKQINYIDFDGINFESEQELSKYVKNFDTYHIGTTKRCPKDIADILNKFFGYTIKSISSVLKSITFKELSEFQNFKNFRSVKVITFSQKTKKWLNHNANVDASTIHEVQGKTFSDVVIVLNDNDQELLKSQAHQVVMISRHTKSCVVYATEKGKNFIDIGETPMDTHLEMFAKFIPIDNELFNPEFKIANDDKVMEDQPMKAADIVDIVTVEKVLQNVVEVCDIGNGDVLPTLLQMKEYVVDKELKVNPTCLNKCETKIKGVRLATKNWAKVTFPKNHAQGLQTLLDRYGRGSKIVKMDRNAIKFANEIVNNFISKSFKVKKPKINKSKLTFHFFDTLKSMQKKNSMDLINDEFTKRTFRISHYMKGQNKVWLKDHKVCGEIKAGQGISNVNKNINLCFSVLFRSIMDTLKDANQIKDHIYIANGQDDNEYGNAVMHELRGIDFDKKKKAVCDISEQDTGYNNFVLFLELLFMRKIGIDEDVIRSYKSVRESYQIICPTVFSMWCENMQTSGQAGTLTGNTLNNLIITSYLIETKNPAFIGVKGDDYVCIADDIKLNEDKVKLLSMVTDQKLKFDLVEIPDFIGYYVTPKGLIPILPKLVMKAISKIIPEEKLFYEYQKNLVQLLGRAMDSDSMKRYTIAINAIVSKVKFNEMEILYDFIQNFNKYTYEEFVKMGRGDISEVYLQYEDMSYMVRDRTEVHISFDYNNIFPNTNYTLKDSNLTYGKENDGFKSEGADSRETLQGNYQTPAEQYALFMAC